MLLLRMNDMWASQLQEANKTAKMMSSPFIHLVWGSAYFRVQWLPRNYIDLFDWISNSNHRRKVAKGFKCPTMSEPRPTKQQKYQPKPSQKETRPFTLPNIAVSQQHMTSELWKFSTFLTPIDNHERKRWKSCSKANPESVHVSRSCLCLLHWCIGVGLDSFFVSRRWKFPSIAAQRNEGNRP